MGRFAIDTSIMKDMKKVAADSYFSNTKMVDIDEIEPNKNNFYSISDIEILADDIERQGIKHSLVVVENAKAGIESGRKYTIISGHRRYEAIRLLLDEHRLTSRLVPVYVELAESDEMMLDLIMLNATTRTMSDSEVFEQYKQLDEIFRRMEKNGKPYKGRMRERIADALNISSAQAGKIENINHNAIPEIVEAVKSGDMSISTANEAAKLEPEKQKNLVEQKRPDEIKHKEVKRMVDEGKNKKTAASGAPVLERNTADSEFPSEKKNSDDEDLKEYAELQSGGDYEFDSSEEFLDSTERKLLLKYFHLILNSGWIETASEYEQLVNIKNKLVQ